MTLEDVIADELHSGMAHTLISDGHYTAASKSIANAVRAFLGSEEVRKGAQEGVQRYMMERTGFVTDEGEGVVAACYGGNWITLRTDQIARAALSSITGDE